MLKQESKFWIGFVICCFISCNTDQRKDSKEDYFVKYKNGSFESYQGVYKNVNDSISLWVEDSLSITKYIAFGEWKLDSIFCFNSDSTKLFSTVNFRNSWFKNAKQDDILELGGARIAGKWYFFFLASTMVVPREMYQSDVHTPLSFQKLSEIAREQLHSGAIIFNKDGTYKPNEAFFKRKFNSTVFQGCTGNDTEACYDSMTVVYCKEKYKYKLTKEEIEEINNAIKESGEGSL